MKKNVFIFVALVWLIFPAFGQKNAALFSANPSKPPYFNALPKRNPSPATARRGYSTRQIPLSKNSGMESTSTGFFITNQGYLATNFHAVEAAEAISVFCSGLGYQNGLKAVVVLEDEGNDLAILKISDPAFSPPASIPFTFRKGTADVGESIFVLGYPMTNSMGKEVKLTNGIISAKTGFNGDVTSYQVSASVQPGNSGGPLFDKNGNILGVINARHNLAENATYAIKIGYLYPMLDLLPAPLQLPTTNALMGLSLPEQVKIASRYTCLLQVTHSESTETFDEPLGEAMALLSEAEDAIDEQEYGVARRLIDQSIALFPENPAAYMLRGYMQLYHQNAFYEAIPDFNRAIALEPSNSVAYFHRGYAFNALENEEEALRDFNKTLALDADDVDAYYMRAGIYIAREKYAEAIADFNQIIRREASADPFIFKMALVYHHKAYCQLRLDKPAEALPVINKALEMEKEKAFIWDTRGQIYFELEQYANCIKDMNKALSIEDAASSFFFRGLARLNLDQTADACSDLLAAGALGISEAYDIASEWCDPEEIRASSAASKVPAKPATGTSDYRQSSQPASPQATPTYSEMLFPTPLNTTTKRAGLLWAQPSHQGKSLLNLPAQTSLQAIGYANGFWKVQVNGTVGFLDEQTIYITFGMRDAIQKK